MTKEIKYFFKTKQNEEAIKNNLAIIFGCYYKTNVCEYKLREIELNENEKRASTEYSAKKYHHYAITLNFKNHIKYALFDKKFKDFIEAMVQSAYVAQ